MDFQLEGKDWTETVALTKVLEEAGVDYFSFTLGTRDVQIPTFHGLTPEGVWNSFIDMISDEVTKPVFYGFNLSTPSLVNEVLENNKKAVVELTQTLITDSNWVKKIKILRERTIIGCTKCYQGCNGYYLKKGESISCMMNPLLFDQHALEIKPADKPKNILVVGAGPAGLTAAIYAARRGHKVTIYEEKPEVGGQILFASKVPGKKDYIHLIELLVRLCERYDVVIDTNHKVIAEESDEIRLNFDEVIIATGMNPEFLDIQGMSSNSIFPYPHIFLNHHKPMGKRIAILGNNRISMDCAIYLLSKSIPDIDYDAWLSSWGVGDPRKYRAGIVGVIPKPMVPEKEITLMTNQNDDFSKNFVSTWKNFETRWLRILGIRSFRSVNMDNYENPTLHISFGKLHENKTTISIDNVIMADKLLPDNALAQQFMKAGLSSTVIGAANQKPSYQYIPLIQCLKEGIRIGNEI